MKPQTFLSSSIRIMLCHSFSHSKTKEPQMKPPIRIQLIFMVNINLLTIITIIIITDKWCMYSMIRPDVWHHNFYIKKYTTITTIFQQPANENYYTEKTHHHHQVISLTNLLTDTQTSHHHIIFSASSNRKLIRKQETGNFLITNYWPIISYQPSWTRFTDFILDMKRFY